mmetsp:Transcript_2076/g.6724  ORF Transcript_2076/g.6724 Transcript_2076/m.6724 type:complete len:340 (-) Transcript_2076:58-1077(-)
MSPVFTSACARGVGAGLVNRCLRPRVWSLAARGRDAAPAPPAFASSASSSRFSASSTSSSSSFTAWAVERNGAGVDASASARCARRSRSRHRGGGGAIPAHLRSRPRGVLVRSTSSAAAEDALRLVQDRLGVTLSEEPTVPPPHPAVVVVSGPSGVGKDAVVRRLRALRPELHFVVTATSRAPRPGEEDGVDYFFVSTEEFEKMIADGELIEHAVVYGQYKGIPKKQVREKLAMNTDVILRLDVQGAATVREMIPGATSVFVCAESEAALARRLARRGTETPDELAERVKTAREETARGVGEFDYVLVNAEGKLDDTAAKLAGIIDAVKLRRGRGAVTL